MIENSVGILLQGAITDWSENVIRKYQENFPNVEILCSTWKSQNTENIPCKVIKLDEPENLPLDVHINHAIIGALEGLKKMNADIIMKCRTDQIIENKHIFKLFEKANSKNKIMIPNFGTFENIDYCASDICQIATRETLLEYWNSIEHFDGTYMPHPEIYYTLNYILHAKKDLSPWKEAIRKYFYIKDYVEDFQIKWEKMTPEWNIKIFFDNFYKNSCKID